MNKRYTTIVIVAALAAIVGVAGYFMPYGDQSPSPRMLFPNKGGPVLFTHEAHVSLTESCAACHHTSGDAEHPPKCTSCHVAKFDEVFAAGHMDAFTDDTQCASCHHALPSLAKFDHDTHVAEYNDNDCRTCHHDKDIEPEPESCAECHGHEAKDNVPSIRDAAHAKCSECHEEPLADGAKSCTLCHERRADNAALMDPVACSTCHKGKTDLLLPTTTNAFHTKCMGCHEERKAGPYTPDDCKKCHR